MKIFTKTTEFDKNVISKRKRGKKSIVQEINLNIQNKFLDCLIVPNDSTLDCIINYASKKLNK
jgi:hypothetical protein